MTSENPPHIQFGERLKRFLRAASRRLVEAGSHTKTRSNFEHQECYEHFYRCMAFLGRNGIEGDILEFGVANGASLVMLDSNASEMLKRRENTDFRIFGFDSFEGLPDSIGSDQHYHAGQSGPGVKFGKGDYSFSLEQVRAKLNSKIGNTEHISLVKGWYDRVLTEDLKNHHDIKQACFINIDCDFYESTKTVLNWCKSLIQQGTIISFDDWFCYRGSAAHGEKRALTEFLKDNPEIAATPYSHFSWHGQSFIMNRHDADLGDVRVVKPRF